MQLVEAKETLPTRIRFGAFEALLAGSLQPLTCHARRPLHDFLLLGHACNCGSQRRSQILYKESFSKNGRIPFTEFDCCLPPRTERSSVSALEGWTMMMKVRRVGSCKRGQGQFSRRHPPMFGTRALRL